MKFYLFALLLFVAWTGFSLPVKVTGYVYEDRNRNGVRDADEKGVKGVAVSDQHFVVQTNETGFYEINTDENYSLLAISLPTGFAAVNSFWARREPGKNQVDFAVFKMPVKDSFTFIHASDTHISNASYPRMEKLIAKIDSIKPDFVIVTGDLVKDALRVSEKEAASYYELYLKALSKISVPVWNVPGNHENFGIERHLSLVGKDHPLYGKKMYQKYLGPNYYSFNYGGIHFVGIDAVDFEDTWYYGHVDSTQIEWLKKDLATVPGSTPVVTFNHIPFFSATLSFEPFTEYGLARSLEREKGVLQFRHVVSNAHEVIEIVSQKKYPLALAGHHHTREVFWYESDKPRIRFEQAAAVVGPNTFDKITMSSGITLYKVNHDQISEGQFIKF